MAVNISRINTLGPFRRYGLAGQLIYPKPFLRIYETVWV
jgi:hypothetical protein